jgi:hypothetical protein
MNHAWWEIHEGMAGVVGARFITTTPFPRVEQSDLIFMENAVPTAQGKPPGTH